MFNMMAMVRVFITEKKCRIYRPSGKKKKKCLGLQDLSWH